MNSRWQGIGISDLIGVQLGHFATASDPAMPLEERTQGRSPGECHDYLHQGTDLARAANRKLAPPIVYLQATFGRRP